jgi:pyruvate/2-oxoglutarate/acetoin dehydrogenase E1 component
VAKGDVGALLEGFRRDGDRGPGYRLYKVRGWDYPTLLHAYRDAVEHARRDHVPAILHVDELTQPQGHSTSGSHERYKSPERLRWEAAHCCNRKMREWLLAEAIATAEELDRLEEEARDRVLEEKQAAWSAYRKPIEEELETVSGLIEAIAPQAADRETVETVAATLRRRQTPLRRDLLAAAEEALVAAAHDGAPAARELVAWKRKQELVNRDRYGSDLYSEGAFSALEVPVVPATYAAASPTVNGFEVLNACFDAALSRYPNLVAFGEDVGRLGDVNQGFAGLQEKHGPLRVSDTGIREATIIGQAVGLALRGIRPIAEIQYLDYLLYCLQILSDDLATLRYRTKGGQKAPVIVRTRGHRLEGIWHSGSPMAGILNLVRGVYLCVPRDMTRAAGLYNTLLQGDDPAIVVEVLNGYRAKEVLPDNVGELTVPLGVPEVLREGRDVTVVTYGAACKVVMEAAELLERVDVDVEVIDVQTLLPFDLGHRIVESLQKTGRIVFVDEDVPGGGTAYMMQQVLEVQRGYVWLDSPPRTVPGTPHRPAYGSDGDYFSKPSRETVFEAVYELMSESDPAGYPEFLK